MEVIVVPILCLSVRTPCENQCTGSSQWGKQTDFCVVRFVRCTEEELIRATEC